MFFGGFWKEFETQRGAFFRTPDFDISSSQKGVFMILLAQIGREFAFSGCSSLDSMDIPKSVISESPIT